VTQLWPKLDASEKREYIVQVVKIMAELRRISAFLPHVRHAAHSGALRVVR
jgi:hypothetical protein